MGLLALLFALVSICGESMSAQSSGSAPAEGQQASSMPSIASVKPPPPADPAKAFNKALRTVEKRGARAHVPDYVTTGLGMPNASVNMEPLWAHVVADHEGLRTIYLLDDTNAAVVVSEVGGHVMFYLVRDGVLKKAAQLKTGRFASKSLQNIPLGAAGAGYIAERDFWMEALASK
jgi:hypothetical protein